MIKSSLNIESYKNWGLFENFERPILIAGPCSAESEEQLMDIARSLKNQGIDTFRAGVWKPRTRPGSFEGMGERALPWLYRVKEELGMKVGLEVATEQHVESVLTYDLDYVWIGARTCANPFAVQGIANILRGCDIPVFVKNPVNPDLELWIGAIERLYNAGITKIGAIHRGFSTYGDSKYRNLPQWQIPIDLRHRFPDLLLLCDPSHISGKREYLYEISQQAMDLQFDGLMIESHNNPDCALSDAAQQIKPEDLQVLLSKLAIRKSVSTDEVFNQNIEALRSCIDEIDTELIDILARRIDLSRQIGEFKKSNNIMILQSSRWDKLLIQVKAMAESRGLSEEFVEKMFKLIHQASIEAQVEVMNNTDR